MSSFLEIEQKTIPEEQKDEEILALSIKRPNLFATLIFRYEDAFLRKALSILRNEEDAEDVVQETFTKIYYYASRFQGVEGASFRSWGYRILINTSITLYQKRKKDRMTTVSLSEELEEVLRDTKVEGLPEKEISDYVIRILSKLPTDLSRMLKLHFIEGMSQKEIADGEGISVAAVKTRVHRGKEAFRKASTPF
jgi:RNA polymerase sigma-70 factor (ECF subfamily)